MTERNLLVNWGKAACRPSSFYSGMHSRSLSWFTSLLLHGKIVCSVELIAEIVILCLTTCRLAALGKRVSLTKVIIGGVL